MSGQGVGRELDHLFLPRDRLPAEAGLDPASPRVRRLLSLVEPLLGFPRHLSQHVGGFVISERPLCELVPIENAAMPERTVIQWDKDDPAPGPLDRGRHRETGAPA